MQKGTVPMMLSPENINNLRDAVSRCMSEKRFNHTLGVEETAAKLAYEVLPDKADELRVAALLHDITKEMQYDAQIDLISRSDMTLTDEDLGTLPALHSFSAVSYAEEYFSEYLTEDIKDALKKHTLGSEDMSIFTEILFVADFIEPTRIYDFCKDTAELMWSEIKKCTTKKEKLKALHKTAFTELDFTVKYLQKTNQNINTRTMKALNYYKTII